MGTCWTTERPPSRKTIVENYKVTNTNSMMATMEAFIKKNNLVNFRCVNLEGEKTLKKEPRGTGDDYYTYVRFGFL